MSSSMRYHSSSHRSKAMSVSTPSERDSSKLPSIYENREKKKKNKDNFDKYYIHPTLRYKLKNENPKTNPENYLD